MIVLFTDFGADDLYVGQVKAMLLQHFPAATVIDLLHSAPNFRVEAGAHLLAALQESFPRGSVFLSIIDPGVGSDRDAVVLQADNKWYVGPDNGLLSIVTARAGAKRTWRIAWRPERLSASFHGRDLFAPVAAWIARGSVPPQTVEEIADLKVRLGASDLAEVIYVDHYGNAVTGLRAASVSRGATVSARGAKLVHAKVFADLPSGSGFWYENSSGLLELAASGASAALLLGIKVGDPVTVEAS